MPNLCRDSQIKTLPKIADVLTQLLQVILSPSKVGNLNLNQNRAKTVGKSL